VLCALAAVLVFGALASGARAAASDADRNETARELVGARHREDRPPRHGAHHHGHHHHHHRHHEKPHQPPCPPTSATASPQAASTVRPASNPICQPPPALPESGLAVALPLAATALAGGYVVVRRRRRAAARA
jgi:hypothetical protein